MKIENLIEYTKIMPSIVMKIIALVIIIDLFLLNISNKTS